LNDKRFEQPIRLKFEPARERVVGSAWEGLECLRDWPVGHSREYRAALRACRDALDGWTPAHRARRALFDAARQAELLADSGEKP
jgi:hypothetical protein